MSSAPAALLDVAPRGRLRGGRGRLTPALGVLRPLWLLPALGLLLLCAGQAGAQGTVQQGTQHGTVQGRLIGNPAKGSLEGATVVLLWFHSNEQGKPASGPIGRQAAGKDGAFKFTNVPIDVKARYQLGSRVDGSLVGSQPFTFAPGEREVTVNLTVAEVVQDRSALSIAEALHILEPRVGKVWVTEVLHLQNGGTNVITTAQTPLELPLPGGADEFEVIRMDAGEGNHERIGPKLLVFGRFRPGITTIAFRYSLPATWGGASFEKSYALPIGELQVLAETGSLELSGPSLRAREAREMDRKTYQVWGASQLPAGATVTFAASGMPAPPWIYLLPLVGFFAIMAGLVLWFLRRRLGAAGAASTV